MDKRKRILYCDDYVGFGDHFRRAAQRLGHEPVFVNDAARAWELIQAGEQFDLIISDNDMPEMTGLEFLKLVRSYPATQDTPFVMYTASDDADLPKAVSILRASFESKGAMMSWTERITKYIL
jgi:two-component system chemotaxis response regulator CheY